MRALLALVLFASTAHADFNVDRVLAPANAVTESTVTDAINLLDIDCKVKETMVVWIVFQGGKVASIDAGGSSDRKAERCITAGLRKTKIAAKQRAVAIVSVGAAGTADAVKLDPFSNPRPGVGKPTPPANVR